MNKIDLETATDVIKLSISQRFVFFSGHLQAVGGESGVVKKGGAGLHDLEGEGGSYSPHFILWGCGIDMVLGYTICTFIPWSFGQVLLSRVACTCGQQKITSLANQNFYH